MGDEMVIADIRDRQKKAVEYWRQQVRKLRPQGLAMAAKVAVTLDAPWLLGELNRLRAELAQVHADHERTVAVHTEAYAELSQAGAKRDELEEQRAIELAALTEELARKNADLNLALAKLAKTGAVVEAAKAWAYGGGSVAARFAPTWEHTKALLAAVDALGGSPRLTARPADEAEAMGEAVEVARGIITAIPPAERGDEPLGIEDLKRLKAYMDRPYKQDGDGSGRCVCGHHYVRHANGGGPCYFGHADALTEDDACPCEEFEDAAASRAGQADGEQ